jgi:hypothetical protein
MTHVLHQEESSPTASDDSAQETVTFASGLSGAGDLNGDGSTDVLDVRLAWSKEKSTRLLTAARSGLDGRILWHRLDTVQPQHLLLPIRARIGKGGRPGILLWEFGMEDNVGPQGAWSFTLRLTGLDGLSGRSLWRYAAAGTSQSGVRDVPRLAGLLQAGPGATSVLVATQRDGGKAPLQAATTTLQPRRSGCPS